MNTIFSTLDLHPRDRFDAWHSIACQTIVPHDAVPDSRTSFEAELSAACIDDIGFVLFENSPMHVTHTARQAGLEPGDEIFVCLQKTGCVALAQNGRETSLHCGSLALLDPRMPYTARFGEASSTLVVKLPRREVEARLGGLGNLAARQLQCGGDRTFVSDLLPVVARHAGTLSSAASAMVKTQVLDLLMMALPAERRPSLIRSSLSARLRTAIEARLSDPALNPAMVADAAGLSVRYANLVLAAENTSIMRLVQARRLERCRQALEDPAQASRSVGEIAYGWGFSDMTHFGRKFRQAHGISPRAYRHRAMFPASAAQPAA